MEREEIREERRLAKERAAEERRRVAAAQRAAATLSRHKEALKREILKKRAALEKELDRQAHVRNRGCDSNIAPTVDAGFDSDDSDDCSD